MRVAARDNFSNPRCAHARRGLIKTELVLNIPTILLLKIQHLQFFGTLPIITTLRLNIPHFSALSPHGQRNIRNGRSDCCRCSYPQASLASQTYVARAEKRGGGNIRLVYLDRFLCVLPECWQYQSHCSIG